MQDLNLSLKALSVSFVEQLVLLDGKSAPVARGLEDTVAIRRDVLEAVVAGELPVNNKTSADDAIRDTEVMVENGKLREASSGGEL